MKEFANLINILGSPTKTLEKQDALINYFSLADDKDKVWVIALFSGRRPRRLVNSSLLPQWCIEIRNIPGWLFSECYGSVGDMAETIALLLPEPTEEQTQASLSSIAAWSGWWTLVRSTSTCKGRTRLFFIPSRAPSPSWQA